tara:strand:- start:354 stop:1832 length:1479 start_codon:yes stop_codon:yes gene_type:complete
MSDELEQTIEELEAEVLAELEEASEKPLGKAKDLGLGSDNAGDDVSNASKPAPNVAGAMSKESVPGTRNSVGGQDHPAAKGDAASGSTTSGGKMSSSVTNTGKGESPSSSTAADGSGKEASAPNNRDDQKVGVAASKQAKPANDKDIERQEKGEPKVKQGSSGETAPGEKKKLAAGDEIEVEEGQEELEEAPKMTKAQHIENIAKMKKADIEEMLAAHAQKLEEAENAESEEELARLESAKQEIEEKIANINVKEDVDALVEGEELSEEFKEKAATIFEAAVKSKIRGEVERIVDETNTQKDTDMETFKEDMTEKVDTYLNYVVEEWTKENELAIERGLKGEIAEDFISGLKQLFEDHYIDVPDEKYDVLEAQSEKIAELEDRLNEEIQKNVEAKEVKDVLVREQVISEVSEDLADTEIEKFTSLVKDVEFSDEESFAEKLNTLKESYFPKVQPSDDNSIDDVDDSTAQDVDTTDTMKKYMSAISRDHKASA